MNKKLIIALVALLVIIVLSVGGIFFIQMDANKKANDFYENLEKYYSSLNVNETGLYIDFSKDKNPVTDTEIKEGIVFYDIDKKLYVLSNLKINGTYCLFKNDKFSCGLFNKENQEVSKLDSYPVYEIGTAVILHDNSSWHVIHSSGEYSKYVTLIKDYRLDINNDNFLVDIGATNDPDRIPFDTNGNKKYDATIQGNVGYYLENTFKPTLTSYGNVLDVRLPNFVELEKVKEVIGLDKLTDQQRTDMQDAEFEVHDLIGLTYDDTIPSFEPIEISEDMLARLNPHWLFNAYSGNYWVLDGNKIRTATWDGDGYSSRKPTTGASVKPVITVSKDMINSTH